MMFEKIHAISAFLKTKKLQSSLKSREDVKAWHTKKISAWLKNDLSKVAFYQNRSFKTLEDLPIINKQIMMDAFADFNQGKITLEDVRSCIDGKMLLANMHCGMSTGTSGNRTYYIISESERFIWLGTILGKLLPTYPFEAMRIAVALPMAAPLYQSVNHLWRLDLKFFNLNDGLEEVVKNIAAYQPAGLIAPPHLLRYFVDANIKLPLKRLYSVAEVLDPFDRDLIANHFKIRVDEIYMASEGLFATPCQHGKLHLCEDVMHFSFEKEGESALVNPIITDFTRTTQIMARYRMNDLLRLDDKPCPCGSPYQAIAEIVGRKDDCFYLYNKQGAIVTLTPDVLRNTILDSSLGIADFRLVHRVNGTVLLQLPDHYSEDVGKQAIHHLNLLFSRFEIVCTLSLDVMEKTIENGKKLRRIKNQYRSGHDGFFQ